jgi:hypothetical protein
MPNIISVAPFDWSQLEKDTEFISWRGSSQSWADVLPASEERFIDSLLEIYSDDNTDEYEHLPMWEAVRITDATRGWYWNKKERWLMKKNKWNSKHIPKSKENK